MKKTIQFSIFIILILIITGFIIFFFNPFNSRNKIIGSMVNYYFQVNDLKQTGKIGESKKIKPAAINVDTETGDVLPYDKNPLLSTEQEKKLESFGVDVEALPKEITPGMASCFVEKLGKERADEIVAGATPELLEFLKAKECLSK